MVDNWYNRYIFSRTKFLSKVRLTFDIIFFINIYIYYFYIIVYEQTLEDSWLFSVIKKYWKIILFLESIYT